MGEEAPLHVVVSAVSYPRADDAGCALWQADLARDDSSPMVTLSLIQALTPRAKPWVVAAEVHGLHVARSAARVWQAHRGRAGECVAGEVVEHSPRRADFERTLRYTAGEALRLLRSPALHVAFDAMEGRKGWVGTQNASGEFGVLLPPTPSERIDLFERIDSTHGGLRVVG